MPIIVFKENQESSLDKEPYLSFNQKFKEKEEAGIDGTRINIDISSCKPGFTKGFDVNPFYGEDYLLKFTFLKNIQKKPDCYLARSSEI